MIDTNMMQTNIKITKYNAMNQMMIKMYNYSKAWSGQITFNEKFCSAENMKDGSTDSIFQKHCHEISWKCISKSYSIIN